MSRCDCCGCVVQADYGTSTVAGTGTIADPFMVTRVDPAFVRPMVRVTGGVMAAVPNNTPTAVIYGTEVFDTNNMWVIGQPTRITFQTRGFYLFGSRVIWPSNLTGNRISTWRYTPANGSGAVNFVSSQSDAPSGDLNKQLNYQWYFEIGDYIELLVTQVSGIALNLNSSSAWAVYTGRKA